MVLNFIMRLNKMTKNKYCFKENMNRIGRIYLPIPAVKEMNIGSEIVLQLATDKRLLLDFPGGYVTLFIQDRKTKNKIRFKEAIEEKGELGLLYIDKDICEHIGIEDKIAVRIVPSAAGRMIC